MHQINFKAKTAISCTLGLSLVTSAFGSDLSELRDLMKSNADPARALVLTRKNEGLTAYVVILESKERTRLGVAELRRLGGELFSSTNQMGRALILQKNDPAVLRQFAGYTEPWRITAARTRYLKEPNIGDLLLNCSAQLELCSSEITTTSLWFTMFTGLPVVREFGDAAFEYAKKLEKMSRELATTTWLPYDRPVADSALGKITMPKPVGSLYELLPKSEALCNKGLAEMLNKIPEKGGEKYDTAFTADLSRMIDIRLQVSATCDTKNPRDFDHLIRLNFSIMHAQFIAQYLTQRTNGRDWAETARDSLIIRKKLGETILAIAKMAEEANKRK